MCYSNSNLGLEFRITLESSFQIDLKGMIKGYIFFVQTFPYGLTFSIMASERANEINVILDGTNYAYWSHLMQKI